MKRVWIVLLPLILLSPAQAFAQGKTKEVKAAFQKAMDTFNRDTEAAVPLLRTLVKKRWKELSAKGRHGAATLLMFAHCAGGRPARAASEGALLHRPRKLGGAFLSLARLSNRTPGWFLHKGQGALDVLALRTALGKSVVYLHNASEKPIEIDAASSRCLLRGSYTHDGKTKRLESARLSPALPGNTIELPAGGGVILSSSKPSGAAPDLVTVLAHEAQRRLRGWIHLTQGGYRHTLQELVLRARVRWGKGRARTLTLIDMERRGGTRGKAAAPTTTQRGHPSYAKAGQRYVFAMADGIKVVRKVLKVSKAGVKYSSTTYVDGSKIGSPQVQLWQPPSKPTRKGKAHKIVVSGRVFRCRVIEKRGAKVWSVPVFPGVIKTVRGGQVRLRLVKIE